MVYQGAYELEHDMGVLCKALNLVKLLMGAEYHLHGELGLKDLGLLSVADEDGDVESARAGVVKETNEDCTSEVAYSIDEPLCTISPELTEKTYQSRQ